MEVKHCSTSEFVQVEQIEDMSTVGKEGGLVTIILCLQRIAML